MLLKTVTERLQGIIKLIIGPSLEQPYWIKISTREPKCVYYFGPFDSITEAQKMQHGYIEDLVAEKAIGIGVRIERCSPTQLTIAEEEELF